MAETGSGEAATPYGAPAEDGWAWAPYAPWEPAEGTRWNTESWAPPSTVRRPWLRMGRWTLLYRRAA